MGKLGGFKEYARVDETNLAVAERISHYREFTVPLKNQELSQQGARCMDCGISFCHSGCPLGNLIPDFNEMVHQNEWESALKILHSTNNFPEFTGRLCPAPCEKACVLGLVEEPVSIENIEKNIVERGFSEGWIKPQVPAHRTEKKIAIVGSGPAGMAAAQQLNRAGHHVTVLERDDAIGGLLRYGIPNFKLEKAIIDRRVAVLEAEGIVFRTQVNVGVTMDIKELEAFDAVVLCGGATQSRFLECHGSDNENVVQAMPFLTQQTQKLYGADVINQISAEGKHVIVIGGGDTGSDCVGTSNRQGAASVTNLEIMPKPPISRSQNTPWPYWPLQLSTSSSHEEGCDRNWMLQTKEFVQDTTGKLIGLKTVEVAMKLEKGSNISFAEKEGTERVWPCDLAIMALGFSGPEKSLSEKLGIELDQEGRYNATQYQTNIPHIFTAGDMRRGQSLIVWAISEGREAAREVDLYLMGDTHLPTKGAGDLPAM